MDGIITWTDDCMVYTEYNKYMSAILQLQDDCTNVCREFIVDGISAAWTDDCMVYTK